MEAWAEEHRDAEGVARLRATVHSMSVQHVSPPSPGLAGAGCPHAPATPTRQASWMHPLSCCRLLHSRGVRLASSSRAWEARSRSRGSASWKEGRRESCPLGVLSVWEDLWEELVGLWM